MLFHRYILYPEIQGIKDSKFVLQYKVSYTVHNWDDCLPLKQPTKRADRLIIHQYGKQTASAFNILEDQIWDTGVFCSMS